MREAKKVKISKINRQLERLGIRKEEEANVKY